MTIPGRKQIFRRFTEKGKIKEDIIGLFGESAPRGTKPLLKQIVSKGKLVKKLPEIEKIRDYSRGCVSSLSKAFMDINEGRNLKPKYTKIINGLRVG